VPKLRRFLALACAVFSLLNCAAASLPDADNPSPEWLARSWQSDEGLPDNTITGLAQIAGGYLWLGTLGGPVSFDGARFRELPIVPLAGVPNRVVRALYVDSSERLWLGMDRGALVRLSTNETKTYNLSDGLPDQLMTCMGEDAQGYLWIAYANSEGLATIMGDHVFFRPQIDHAPRRGPWWLAADPHHNLWFSKGGAIGVIENFQAKVLYQVDDNHARVAIARTGGIWVFGNGRLYRARSGDDELQEMARLDGGASIRASALLEDQSGAVWIGAGGRGLFRLKDSNFESMPTSHRSITCLAEDHEGNIWAGTAGGGINRLRPRAVELLNLQSGLPFEAIRSVCQDSTGALWATSQNGALGRQTPDGWINISAQTNWTGSLATCVAAHPDGSVWIGTEDRGLRHYRNGQYETFSTREGLASLNVRSLLATPSGELWIGLENPNRIQRLFDGKLETFHPPPKARFLRAMAYDNKNRLWIGTSDGQLLTLQNNELVPEPNTLQRPHSIRCVTATGDGALWIGYAGIGLGRLKDGQLQRISLTNGLADSYISQIVADERGWLWFGSNRGIFQVRLTELDDFFAGKIDRVRSIVYGKGEGLASLQASFDYFPGGFRGAKGLLYIPTRTGLAVIHPEQIHDNPEPPKVLIENIAIDSPSAPPDDLNPLSARPLPWAGFMRFPSPALRVPPRHHKVDFDFTALTFTAPDNVHFKYRLEGVDPDWVEAGPVRHASYTLLPARNYKFRVMACNHLGIWNTAPTTLAFTVLPFYYQTWWFRTAMLLLFSAALVAAARLILLRRVRGQMRALEQQAALHKERARIAKDIHDDLGASLTEISLLTELAQTDAAPDKTTDYFNRIATTSRHVIKSLDEIVWAVNPRNDTLADFIDYTAQFALDHLRLADIRCRLDLPEVAPERQLSADVRHNLFLAAKEALHNVVKHSGATETWLRIAVSPEGLRITIEDNGKGFEFAPETPTADGLRNMENRLRDIGGALKIQTQLNHGAKITIELPWPKN
jgi:ligand-binding sensor domain-containing protein/signal transduction histidine kinase